MPKADISVVVAVPGVAVAVVITEVATSTTSTKSARTEYIGSSRFAVRSSEVSERSSNTCFVPRSSGEKRWIPGSPRNSSFEGSDYFEQPTSPELGNAHSKRSRSPGVSLAAVKPDRVVLPPPEGVRAADQASLRYRDSSTGTTAAVTVPKYAATSPSRDASLTWRARPVASRFEQRRQQVVAESLWLLSGRPPPARPP